MASLRICFLFLTFICVLAVNAELTGQKPLGGDIWAVLVAGSKYYINYGQQANVCHVYHVLRKRGIPESNIVVMMYDDIANNSDNPHKGVIINEPGGPNVYPGVPHDYVGDDVTPDNFFKILLGDPSLAASGKKVLKSGPNDNVFVYYTDHGAPGVIAFPNEHLYASELQHTILQMYKQRKYGKMVLYIEACYSGSMFDGLLPNDINVYATTSSKPTELSYECYCQNPLNTCLSTCYSLHWIDDIEKPPVQAETLEQQYKNVRRETTQSTVMQYGNLTMAELPVSQFQGAKTGGSIRVRPRSTGAYDVVSTRDAPLEFARRRYLASRTPDESRRNKEIYERMQFLRSSLNNTMFQLARVLSTFADVELESLWSEHNRIENLECHEAMVKAFSKHCVNMSRHPHALSYLYIFVNFCNAMPDKAIEVASRRTMVSFCKREVDFSGVESIE